MAQDETHHLGIGYLLWILLTFVGVFGIHRIYMGKYLTGLIYFLTGGLFFVGILYDYWTLNEQIDALSGRLGG